ncbi:hypothetical protein D9757_004721 [Collybiopsis confluens]|uniref:Zn(2)-C6 fungal-type domain-containing protein n=1 Tax=Collybiopsis confluens TaxID=2823264 RepID=A0A8H5MC73_9AGAR|nr:hypothetical protein D9757_004721 [Collybiopsis confluens]
MSAYHVFAASVKCSYNLTREFNSVLLSRCPPSSPFHLHCTWLYPMDWHDSDGSEDGDTQAASRKRSSRACDQCRKTKSKCEKGVGEGTPCKSCTLAGTTCTFLGPSYKRGPPKESLPLLPLFDPPSLPPPVQGYIHAIEQRWHQVESLLGVVLQCTDPRVQGVVADLRQDDLAREILNRVDMGPYGPTGRRYQSQGATKEDFFASVLRSNGVTPDRGLSIVPTAEWQDNLAARLSSSPSTSTSYIAPSSSSDGPIVQRRRLDSTPTDSQPDWNEMYTLADPEEPVDITEGIGELSLTENQEIRYHGKASGLHFLSKDNRTDDRVEGGVWKMPMARVWPPSKDFAVHSIQEDEIEVELPPPHVQDHLVELYFTYIHPVFPVIHKGRFLSEYSARREGQARENSPYSTSSSPKPESSQKCTNLLLLTIFSITARFCDDQPPNPPATINQMWEAGHQHLEQARKILTKIFDRSRPSTVQSLLLLGYREFGIGSMEQGWIYIGMAIRMAVDLGLHRNSDQWKHHGHNLFSKDEVQTRRQIWWCCCLGDRYGSTYMGRPIVIRDEDFDTPLPEIQEVGKIRVIHIHDILCAYRSTLPQEDDLELWQPSASDLLNIRPYAPVPCHVIACLRKTGELIVVLGRIVSKLYPIAATDLTPKRAILQTLEVQLDQWYITLPEHLRYDVASKRGQVPPPHIIFIHIRYWGAILLLNRAFIPNWTEVDFASPRSTLESKALDLSQSAATHLSALVTVWRETFSLKRCSPFLTSYMLSTGIMHLLTLRLRPSNPQAAHGLRQCLDALEDMAVLWPSASRARDLLSGVRVGVSDFMSRPSNASKLKRHVDDAFGHDDNAEYVQREALREGPQQVPTHAQVAHRTGQDGVQDFSQRIMAHMLGLDVPGVEPSTSLYPGYEWWPRPGQSQGPATIEGHMAQHPSSFSQVSANINPQMRNSDMDTYNSPVVGWMPDGGMMTNASNTVPEYSNYPYNYTQYGL